MKNIHRGSLRFACVVVMVMLTAPVFSAVGPPASSHLLPVHPTGPLPRLSRLDRISYQRAIEDVYWRHRVWPAENPGPKPSIDEYLPDSAVAAKVDDYLRKSAALEYIWQRPITGEQLQTEINRMAKQSRDPGLLAELWAALANNPIVIAECLAKPVLADHGLRNLYAYDAELHHDQKVRAETELSLHPSPRDLKATSGLYSETELSPSGKSSEGIVGHGRTANRAPRAIAQDEMTELILRLSRAFRIGAPSGSQVGIPQPRAAIGHNNESDIAAGLPVGVVSTLQENPDAYWAAAILEGGGSRVKVAMVTWPKETFDSWWRRTQNTIPSAEAPTDYNFKLPRISPASATETDSWSPIASNRIPDSRGFHTAVWTGSEMIVWGGSAGLPFGELFPTGFIYNPGTDTWRAASSTNAPSPRIGHTAIWTGTQMIIWGGIIDVLTQTSTNTGAIYDPVSDTWTQTSPTGVPNSRTGHAAVWTGTGMIVWGGAFDAVQPLNTGGVYDPKSDTWAATSIVSAPTPRGNRTAVWTGAQMIIWGGNGANVNAGGKYDPSSDSWTPTSLSGAPDARMNHTAIWDGTEMIIWGGDPGISFLPFKSGGRYNPSTDTWSPTTLTNAPDARRTHTAVWTGSEMIVWGGTGTGPNEGSLPILTSGGIYNPATDQWKATSQTGPQGAVDLRVGHSAVWTGAQMIVWGGGVDTGGRYNPDTDSWTSTAVSGLPPTVAPGVWTGVEMIIWGGPITSNVSRFTNEGGRYNPALDSWTATSVIDAPVPREGNTAVWDGTEMIIWGGITILGRV